MTGDSFGRNWRIAFSLAKGAGEEPSATRAIAAFRA